MRSIRWGHHSTDISHLIAELYKNVELMDCEFDTDGGLVKAHRVILAACSPYFKNLLVDYNKMIIPLKEIKYSDMKYILDFMYYGQVDVPVVDVPSFMKTAQFLQVVSFITFDSNFMKNSSCHDAYGTHLSNSCDVNFRNSKENSIEYGVSVLQEGTIVDTDLQTVSVALPEVIDVTKQLSEVTDSHKYEAKNFKSTAVKLAIDDADGENFNNHLNPISFVAVTPLSEHIGEHDEMSSDAELQNPLKDDSDLTPARLATRQGSLKTVPRTQRNFEGKMNSSMPGSHPVCDNKVLFDYLSGKTVGNSILAAALASDSKPKQNVTFDKMVDTGHFKDSSVKRSADLEVKFESICDISEHEIKEEKLCENMIPQNVAVFGNAPLTWAESNGDPKEEPDNFTDRLDHEDIKSPVTSRMDSTEAKLINPSGEECGNENPAPPEMRVSTKIQSIPTKKKAIPKKKPFNSSQRDGIFRSKMMHDLSLHSGREVLVGPSLSTTENGLQQCASTPCSELKRITCSICEASFTKKASLKKHIQRIHTDLKKFPCSICQETFKSKCLVEVHMLSHAGQKPFLCEFCGSSFDREFKMKNHVRYHLSCYQCEICPKAFRMKSHLIEHTRTHTGEKPFSCEICQVSYSRKYALKQHIQLHMGEKRFKCEICNESFDRIVSLRKHFQKHTGENNFTCGICSESFACGETLKAHIAIHRSRKSFSSDSSQMPIPRKVNFKKHVRTHSVVKPYSCRICKRCFLSNYELTNHMRTHTGEKPFSCDVCKMSFCRKNRLRVHVLATHTNQKELVCAICNASFSWRRRLDKHLRTHTIEKLFSC